MHLTCMSHGVTISRYMSMCCTPTLAGHGGAAGCKTQLVCACCICHMTHDAAGHYYNRVHVTSIGCIMWGVCTAAFSACQSLKQGYLFWAINGVGLSLVIPTGQSLIADFYQVQHLSMQPM